MTTSPKRHSKKKVPRNSLIGNIDAAILKPSPLRFVSNAGVPACQRVIDNPDMDKAWEKMAAMPTFDNEFLTNFMTTCGQMDATWNALPKVTQSERKKATREIASLAQELADLLDKRRSEILQQTGVSAELRHYIQSAADDIGPSSAAVVKKAIQNISSMEWELEFKLMPTFQDVLRTFADDLYATENNHDPRVPRKIRESEAKRTFFVRSLASFFVEHTGSPHFDIVAPTVNAILNSSVPLDANHAAKLAKGLS